MRIERIDRDRAVVTLSADELDLIANSLNEVCHALEDWEFSTRVGSEKPEALKLLHDVSDARQRMQTTG